MSDIDRKSVKHLADLARLELHEKEEEKIAGDLKNILAHFSELESLDTQNIVPMTGGTQLKNIFREDEAHSGSLSADRVVEAFPEKEKHWLKVPNVFEK